jgi:hypothetical protein
MKPVDAANLLTTRLPTSVMYKSSPEGLTAMAIGELSRALVAGPLSPE